MLELNKIYCGDCLEVMKQIPDKSIDLVLTDPPYGIEYEGGMPNSDVFSPIANDKVGDIDFKLLIQELRRIGKMVIIFGANNFYMDLPHKGGWLCWDKRCTTEADKLFGAPFELAWVDKENQGSGGLHMYRLQHGGARNSDGQGLPRYHPTQKPIMLMKMILEHYSEKGQTILDPFLGSGTTAIACKELGRNFIGIEKEERYCAIARDRLAHTTISLFT